MKRIVHIITGLNKGGAETMLYNILKNSSKDQFQHQVISLIKDGYYIEKIKDLNIEVFNYQISSRPIKTIFKIFKHFKKADTVCCWMYHANFIGLICGKMAGVKNIIWGIRHSNLEVSRNKRSTLFLNKVCSFLSRFVNIVTYNGQTAKRVHEDIGYDQSKSMVLNNGCDTSIYSPICNARSTLCAELSIPANKKIMLSAVRYSPLKDIPNFINALSLVKEEFPDVVGVMCGHRIDLHNEELVSIIQSKNLIIDKDIYLLGLRHDMPLIMSASDVYILHSAGEAFPNTLIEAMACESLCVVTDVGDAKLILDDNERVVECSNYIALSSVIKNTLVEKSDVAENRRKKYRNRVVEHFSIKSIVTQYENNF
ncbi:glycosyltransferase [Chengkuizengella sp. SCS-71B]|uniref:glycosyltransferase n=1 Tax=Chengkuizengella sp. SCS-71B TaxID=3115290 RepID=UPI0032C24AC2